MRGFVETHRSFVNTWECDENQHMNVQFYMKRFDEAARFFAALEGGALDAPLPVARHIRYHGELRAGGLTTIRSGRIAGGPHRGRVAHLLDDPATGTLSATAIDSDEAGGSGDGRYPVDLPDSANPRSLPDGPSPLLGKSALIAAGGLVTHRRLLHPGDCNLIGNLNAQHYVGIASDGAPHVWNHSRFGSSWLVDNGYGRVAVEMKATFLEPAKAGDAVELVSAPAEIGARTLTLHHELVRLKDSRPLAAIDVVALIINLSTRRAVGAEEFAAFRDAAA